MTLIPVSGICDMRASLWLPCGSDGEESCLQCRSESESHSVVSNSLRPHGLFCTWNSPGQNTGVGSHSFLQGIFPTQGSNSSLLHCRQILYQLSHCGSLRYNPWVREIPWRRKWQPTPAIMTGESHGQKSLVGCSPLGCKESNMTEWQTHRYALYSELFLHVFVCVCVYVCVWWSCKERTVINILRTRRPW